MGDAIAGARRRMIFERIWSGNSWGSEESRSGPGSELVRTSEFRVALERFLERVAPSILYDAPCGDFNWMRTVNLPAQTAYIGADIVRPMIDRLQGALGSDRRRFIVCDIVRDAPPAADVWLCRETLFHLSNREVRSVIARWRGSAIPYFLATTTPTLTSQDDGRTGGFRALNLELDDFDLGPAAEYLPDGTANDPGKVVGVWRPTARK